MQKIYAIISNTKPCSSVIVRNYYYYLVSFFLKSGQILVSFFEEWPDFWSEFCNFVVSKIIGHWGCCVSGVFNMTIRFL